MIESTAAAQARPAARPVAERSARLGRTVLGFVSALSYLFLYVPIAVLVIYSFTADTFGVRWTGFTLDWYRRLFEDERMIEAALNTLKVALISTLERRPPRRLDRYYTMALDYFYWVGARTALRSGGPVPGR